MCRRRTGMRRSQACGSFWFRWRSLGPVGCSGRPVHRTTAELSRSGAFVLSIRASRNCGSSSLTCVPATTRLAFGASRVHRQPVRSSQRRRPASDGRQLSTASSASVASRSRDIPEHWRSRVPSALERRCGRPTACRSDELVAVAFGESISDHDERLAPLDDVSRELGSVAVNGMDGLCWDRQRLARAVSSRLPAVDLVLE
jgi:hypothetical protein